MDPLANVGIGCVRVTTSNTSVAISPKSRDVSRIEDELAKKGENEIVMEDLTEKYEAEDVELNVERSVGSTMVEDRSVGLVSLGDLEERMHSVEKLLRMIVGRMDSESCSLGAKLEA